MEDIQAIAKKHKKTPGQILLAWAVNTRGIAVIPKTVNESRLKENLDILNIHLDEDDERVIDEFDRGLRFNDQGLLWGIPLY